MAYEVYALHPSAELVDVCDELESAVARCEELVHEEAYPGAEVWDTDGELVHAVGRASAMQPSWSRRRSDERPVPALTPTNDVPSGERDADGDDAAEGDADAARIDVEVTLDAAATDVGGRPAAAEVEPPVESRPPRDASAGAVAVTAEHGDPAPPSPSATLLGEAESVQWFGA